MAKDQSDSRGDLDIINVTKRFGQTVVVDDLSLKVSEGVFFALLGPSGCGKTTTLRMLAGLEQPTEGRIHLAGQDITRLPPNRRPINTVFQSYALFPHMTVFENVAFGLRERRQKDIEAKVRSTLEMVELGGFGDRRPTLLSGGQQQRVALARAIVNEPHVLLLDEPLGALDLKLRRQMQLQLKRIHNELGLTFVHVTHDQEEAMTMADVIAVMNQGKIEQMGTPEELYEHPRTKFVANFLGSSNLLRGRVTGRDGEMVMIDVPGGAVVVPASRTHSTRQAVYVGVRPEKLHIVVAEAEPAGHNAVQGTVVDSIFTGIGTDYQVALSDGHEVRVFAQNLSTGDRLAAGTTVLLHWEIGHTFVFDIDDTDPGNESADLHALSGAGSVS